VPIGTFWCAKCRSAPQSATPIELHGSGEAATVISDGGNVEGLRLTALILPELNSLRRAIFGGLLRNVKFFHDGGFHVIHSGGVEVVVLITRRFSDRMTDWTHIFQDFLIWIAVVVILGGSSGGCPCFCYGGLHFHL
jgi:hypothetical protein